MVDVARTAGCSQSTVSIVLNHTPGFNISPETRRRVAEAVISLGYVPRPPRARGGQSATEAPGAAEAGEQRPAAQLGQVPRPIGTFAGQVSRSLAIEILSGRYAPGSILPGDTELMARFGVSRTVLREALKVLAGKGLIKARAKVGTRVQPRSDWHLFDPDVLVWQAEAGLSQAFIASLSEMRMMLEPEAAALAATRRSQADVEEMYRCARRMGASRGSWDAFTLADLEFHLAVVVAADNPFLRAVSTLIEVALTAAMKRSWPGNDPGGIERSASDHAAIARAIERGDPDAARAAMRVVIAEGAMRASGPVR
jgi:DNA-binding FadR family transcriptional regulator